MFGTQQGLLARPNSNAHVVEALSQSEHTFFVRNIHRNLKRYKLKTLFIIFGIICAIVLLVWLYVEHTLPEFNQHRLVKNSNKLSNESDLHKTRFILLWNDFFGDKRWSLPDDVNDPSFFRKEIGCPVSNCVLTNKRDILPKIEMYDAIIFHTAVPFPFINSMPNIRSWKQFYVFALMEPPGETKHILSDEENFYNLTMSYRMDSDILWTYGYIIDKETNMRMIPSEYPKWRSVSSRYNDSNLWDLWTKKTKMAAWFVSNCKTLSRREELVREIQKYMQVDIFGKCGSKSCPRGSSECDRMLDEDYKFYFSFENSLCTDYITEKTYNILKRNIVPVVYGGANYEHFLPPHSYINVEDYETPEDLADYLVYLSENPEEYLRYFWWRQYYDLKYFEPYCDLCKRLHQPNYLLKTQIYQNIAKWWLSGTCRFKTRIKF